MGLELWPLSKRSQTSVDISIVDSDGPIIYWREDGHAIPIIPVMRALQWGMGGARFAYVAFEGVQEKQFALCFDEPRLFETIVRLLEATGLYEQSGIVPVFPAENLAIEQLKGDHKLLRIKMKGGATIAFHLSPELIALLQQELSNK